MLATSGIEKAPSPSGCVDPNAAGCAQLRDDRDSYDSQRTASTVFFYSGLAVGALTVAAVLLWPSERVVASVLPVGGPRKGVASGVIDPLLAGLCATSKNECGA